VAGDLFYTRRFGTKRILSTQCEVGMTISLRELTPDNWEEYIALRVCEDQQAHVDTNAGETWDEEPVTRLRNST